jgi:hypothetical protein
MQEEHEETRKIMREHLEQGTIRISKSPYCANFFYVQKKDKKL